MSDIKLSIIVPVYNEENTILEILKKINKINLIDDFEIIVINDGSRDNTEKIIKNNDDLYTKSLFFKKNSGKGNAVIEGIKSSEGSYIIIQDADLEYNPKDIETLYKKAINYKADIVMGSRFIGNDRSVLNFWHMIGNRFISFVFNMLNNTTFSDIYCCYSLLNSKLIKTENLKSKGWGQQAEILTYAVNKSSKIYEIAVSYDARKYDEGKKIKYYHVIDVLYWIFLTKIKTYLKK